MIRRLRWIARPGYRSAPTSSAATMIARLVYGGRLSLFLAVAVMIAFSIGATLA